MALAESQLPQQRSSRAWRLASDDVLARAVARGDRAAFEALFDRHQPALLRYARSLLLDADAAQDATQSAFAAALRALGGTGPQPVAVKGWLFRIAHNEAMTLLRARSTDSSVPVADVLERVGVAAAADDPVRERLHELVADLRVLPERQRAALLMRELSGLAYGEIATVLVISEGAARQAVCDARAGLHDMNGGRATACAAVRRSISDDDRRVLRGRALRAHLANCAPCAGFAGQIRRRRHDLRILVPAGPVLALTLLAGGGAAGGSATGGGLALGFGASSALKCAAACASVAVVGIGGVGALNTGPDPGRAVQERPRTAATAPGVGGAASGRPPGRTARPQVAAATQSAAPRPASRAAVAVMPGGALGPAVGSGAIRSTGHATEDTGADEAKPSQSSSPVAPGRGSSAPQAPDTGTPGAPAAGTGNSGPDATAATTTPTGTRTVYSPVVALALAEARDELDAALAAARQATEQALAGATPTRTQAAPSVSDAFTLLDAVLRRG